MKTLCAALLCLLPWLGYASENNEFQEVSVNFTSNDQAQHWIAKSYERATEKFISGFKKIQTVDNSDKADYLWAGQLKSKEIEYQIVERATGALISEGSLRVGEKTSSIQLEVLDAVRPLVRNGGLVDQMISRRNQVFHDIPLNLAQQHLLRIPKSTMSAISLVGGISWGIVLLILFSMIFGTLHGLERIWHWNLAQYTLSFIELTAIKTIFAVITISPVIIAALILIQKLNFNAFLVGYVLVPILTLFLFALIVTFGAILTRWLDIYYIDVKLKHVSIWDRQIKRYFYGHLRRLGVNIPHSVIEKVIFVPGKTKHIGVYGGGLVRSRIVIPRSYIELALGEPEETPYDSLEQTPDNANEPLARILPKKWDSSIQPKLNEKNIEKALSKSIFPLTVRQQFSEPTGGSGIPMEHSAGVWGHIRPNPEKTVGLISDNLQDLKIVRELLQEHQVHFAKLQFDEEYDDSDPNTYDFLFGAILREVGKVHRKESLFFTFFLAMEKCIQKTNEFIINYYKKLKDLYTSNLSKHYSIIDDGYVVLHHGRHHLAQFLYLQLSYDQSLLSLRASHQNLFLFSSKIFSKFKSIEPESIDLRKNRSTLKNRLLWLSRYFSFALPDYPYIKRKPIISIGLGVAALITVILEIYTSYSYSQVYLDKKIAFTKELNMYHQQKEK
ncbi:MAG: hypothetical protein CL677_02065 [Bdellovibrionaceae bacterium]|nr:hypothetical protein [Pseudobdellovibrionaceae bacterium]|tara:strand:- start:28457 stop:30466 length:2010 start_codon:yes stop_codon:yes gene_type:complete